MLPDGEPHVTPVWVDCDDDADRLLIDTERGRRKERNVRRNPEAGVRTVDPDDPYRRLSVTGEVTEMTTEGAREHGDEPARRYTGDDYDTPIRAERVLLRIRADRVMT